MVCGCGGHKLVPWSRYVICLCGGHHLCPDQGICTKCGGHQLGPDPAI